MKIQRQRRRSTIKMTTDKLSAASSSSTMTNSSWTPTTPLINSLKPSTSKDYVLPRLERSVFVQRKEVMKNFITITERTRSISDKYFDDIQLEITPPMRSMLFEWMVEVCEEEGCTSEIFPLAASYVDRFLSVEAVHKRQLQALGTACLFIAGKVKMIAPFNATRLVEYTDEAVSMSELLSWEMLVLDRLNWDVSTLTAMDYLDQYVHRMALSNKLIAGLRPYLNYLVGLSVIDFPIAALSPCVMAASCLQVAATHLFADVDAGREMIESLNGIIAMDTVQVETHARRIHELFVQKQRGSNKLKLTSSMENWRPLADETLERSICVDQESSSSSTSSSMSCATSTNNLTPTEIEDVVIF